MAIMSSVGYTARAGLLNLSLPRSMDRNWETVRENCLGC